MFQFTGFASFTGYYTFSIVGCPIRTSADHIVCANPRSFSQLITSFIASESLGIPHTPLTSLSPMPRNSNVWYSVSLQNTRSCFFKKIRVFSLKNYIPYNMIYNPRIPNMSMNVWRVATDSY